MIAAKACALGFGLLVLCSSARGELCSGAGGACLAGSPYNNGGGKEIPGTIQAEEFDYGGEAVGYSDSTDGNSGTKKVQDGSDLSDWGERMDEDVDVTEKILFNDDWVVGWINAGEYLRYTVNVTRDVKGFVSRFLVSAPTGSSGAFRVVSGGTDCDDYTTDHTGLVDVWPTGDHFDDYKEVTASSRNGLPKGPTFIWLCVEFGGFNIDSFTMDEDAEGLQMYD